MRAMLLIEDVLWLSVHDLTTVWGGWRGSKATHVFELIVVYGGLMLIYL